MTFKEAIQKDSQKHLYVKSVITSETTQYVPPFSRKIKYKNFFSSFKTQKGGRWGPRF